MAARRVNISITKEQYAWVRANHISLSRLIQSVLIEKMKETG